MELLNFMLMNLQIQAMKSYFKIIVVTFVGQKPIMYICQNT